MSAALLDADATAAKDAPLCVDLDGTLVMTDTLVELLVALRPGLGESAALVRRLAAGRAAFKSEIALRGRLDPGALPYVEPLVDYIRTQRQRGRRIVLATAADRKVAQAIAAHLGLFDEVIASDGARNLKGVAKAEALVGRFGERGFVYAGNEAADLAVWQRARAAVLVNVPPAVAAAVERSIPIEGRFAERGSTFSLLLRAMRPHRWVKNLLVAVPLITGAPVVFDAGPWARAAVAFAAFSLLASAVYIVNDILDIGVDRAHPKKRGRPFATGALPVSTGLAAASCLLVASGILGAVFGLLSTLVLYAMVALAYSIWLKERPLVDVFALAALSTLRLFAGGLAAGYHVSLWLLGFASFFFLGLAFLKRIEEFDWAARRSGRAVTRHGYDLTDRHTLQLFGCCSSFVSALVLALYVENSTATSNYSRSLLMWSAVPLMLFWQLRLWLATARGEIREDPIVFAARDWVSWLVCAGSVLVLLAARLF